MNLGEVTTLTFAGGQSSAGGSLVAYKAEAGVALAVTDQTLSSSSAGGYEVVLTVPNVAPVANTGSVARARNTQLRILISNLLTNGTDPNADPVSFVSVSPTSTDGAALYTNATQILYHPQSGHNPASDSFTYTISDGQLTATGIVIVSLLPDPTGLTFNIVSAGGYGSGHPTITFAGIPDYIYKVQRSANLTNWTDLRTTNAPAAGPVPGHRPQPLQPRVLPRDQPVILGNATPIMKTILCTGLRSLALNLSALAGLYTFSSGFQNNGVVPDGNVNGWTDTRT